MRDVFSGPESSRVGFYCNLLKQAGFNAFVRNEFVSGAEAVIPAFYPTVAIMEDDRFDEAKALLLEQINAPHNYAGDWTCPHCQESVPDSFDSCWKCETIRPEASV